MTTMTTWLRDMCGKGTSAFSTPQSEFVHNGQTATAPLTGRYRAARFRSLMSGVISVVIVIVGPEGAGDGGARS